MMSPVFIDITEVAEGVSMTEDEVEDFSSSLSQKIEESFQKNWDKVVKENLHSTRSEYQRGMYTERIDSNTFEVGLTRRQSEMAMDIEEGKSPFDMKCIVDRFTTVFTSKGVEKIKNIKVGDLVLTHEGKFERVLKTNKEYNNDDFIYKIESKNRSIFVTKNHPIMTNKGWVFAENLNEEIHKIKMLASVCEYCGKLFISSKMNGNGKFCSKSCAAKKNNESRVGKKRFDLSKETLKHIGECVKKTNERMYKEGKHFSQREDFNEKMREGWLNMSDEKKAQIFKKAAQTAGRNNHFSDPESVLWKRIKNIEGITRQHPFTRDSYYFRKNGCKKIYRKFYFDFAIPHHKICIEVNGERFHTVEQDEERKKEVESKGWRYLSFWSKEIYRDLDNCVKEIERVLKNHNGEYRFLEENFTIEKINHKDRNKLSTRFNYKYDLTVENASSFVANNIVVHNSGFAKSSKKKFNKEGGWYLTIPLVAATPEALAESTTFANKMPKPVYEKAKKLKGNQQLKKNDLPSENQALGVRPAIHRAGKSYAAYEHKSPIFEGLQKGQKKYHGQYNTFRRVGSNSDSNSWIHKGFIAKNLMDKAWNQMDIESIVAYSKDEFLGI